MRNQTHNLSTEELARVAAVSETLFAADTASLPIEFLYFKETTGETTRREGTPNGVFGGYQSKMSVFVEHPDGTKKSYNVRNILRLKLSD